MTPDRPPVIGLSLSPTWLRGDAWRDPGSRAEDLASGEALIAAAALADEAGAHVAFKPDRLSMNPATLADWPGQTGPDATVLMAAVARETSRIGLIPTYSATYAPPYLVARELQSLDQLSRGRAGWNAVTSLGGAENFPGPERTSEERYRDAAEMIEVVRRLHASYPARAVRIERAGGVFADPGAVAPIEPAGRFEVAGPLTVPAYVDEPMPLLHAGGSPASRDLAAAHADAVFAMTAEDDDGIRLAVDLAERASRVGRRAPRVLPGLVACLAGTREEAEERYARAMSAPGGAAHWTVVGTPRDAADAIERRIAAGAAEGVLALPFGSWEAVELFAAEVVPELIRRGVSAAHDGDLRAAMRV